ncbi:hypothetical protein BH10PSE6_BH10PSE6_31200 [soil metagenome]
MPVARVSTSPVRWVIVPSPDEPYQYWPGFCLASTTNSCQLLAPSLVVMVTGSTGVDSRHTAISASGSYGTFRTDGVIAMIAVGDRRSV